MAVDGNYIEELGFKAEELGVFKQWQQLTYKICKQKKLPIDKAAEVAFSLLL
jgi:hypothetical protein